MDSEWTRSYHFYSRSRPTGSMITTAQREKLAISNLKIHSKQGITYVPQRNFYLLSVSAERRERKAGFG